MSRLGIGPTAFCPSQDSPERQLEPGILCLPPTFDLDIGHALRVTALRQTTPEPLHAEAERHVVGVGRLMVAGDIALLVDDRGDNREVGGLDHAA